MGSIEVTQTMTTTADDCTLMMTTEGDLATPAEICALCPSPSLSARIAGHGLCNSCVSLLRHLQGNVEEGEKQEKEGSSDHSPCLTGLNCCPVAGPGEQRCPSCFARRAQALGIDTAALLGLKERKNIDEKEKEEEGEEETLKQAEAELAEKKTEWVEMMSAKRKQQAEESRVKREEETRR